MFSWQIGSGPQLTGEEAGKLSQRDMPLFISAHTELRMSPGPAGNNSSIPACPSLITAGTSHLKEEIVLRLYPDLIGHLLYSIERGDKKGIFLIPQKKFLSGTAFNLLFVHYSLDQLAREKLFT